MSNICIHVGNQIRYFRKLRGILLKEFSLLLNKSISTISKYENGFISVDIQTLEKIAHILGVTLEQLLPFATPTVTREALPLDNKKNFFQQTDVFYMYYYLEPNNKSHAKGISVNVIEISRNENGLDDEVTLYNECTSPEVNYRNCLYVYHGKVRYYDFVVYFLLENAFHPGSFDYICAKVPFNNTGTTSGLYTGLSESIRNPCATKVLFSTVPLELTDELAFRLMISDKETIYGLKHNNSLIIR